MTRAQIIKKEFVSFLKKHKALKQYKINVYNYMKGINRGRWEYYIFPISQFSHNGSKTMLIDGAFRWASTPQGHTFWEELSHKWRTYINNIQL